MPVQTRHPGVYVEEVPSGVHTIVGVGTSVTAFVGATRMGPERPVRVRSVADFVRTFGAPLDEANPLGHCVAHFFANGGSEAIVVRVASGTAAAAELALSGKREDTGKDTVVLNLSASSLGSWATRAGGSGLEASVEANGDRFDLTISLYGVDRRSGASALIGEEVYADLTLASGDPRFVLTALEPSRLVKASVPEVHGFSRSKEALPGNFTFKTDNNVLKLAVDGAAPVEVKLFESQLESNPEAKPTRSAVVDELSKLLADLGVTASLGSGEHKDFLILTSDTEGSASAVAVTAAAASNAAALGLGGNEVTGAVQLPPPTATSEALGFEGGADGGAPGGPLVSPAEVIPEDENGGIYALRELRFPRFNLLCLPGVTSDEDEELGRALSYCKQERAFLIVDTPSGWEIDPPDVGNLPALGEHGALYYPRLRQSAPAPGGVSVSLNLPVCGAVAGAFARTDAERGVWKAPAGLETGLVGFGELSVPTDDALSDVLNPQGVNALRSFPGAGTVVWGVRTLKGDDSQGSEFKYVPVRRTTDFIASSLYLGTQFAVFEPNDPDLWAQLRLAVGTFMRGLFRRGAFQQSEKRAESDSFFVVCDETVNPQSEIDLGRVNVAVGFAPLKPAEFVVITITQMSQLEE